MISKTIIFDNSAILNSLIKHNTQTVEETGCVTKLHSPSIPFQAKTENSASALSVLMIYRCKARIKIALKCVPFITENKCFYVLTSFCQLNCFYAEIFFL